MKAAPPAEAAWWVEAVAVALANRHRAAVLERADHPAVAPEVRQ
jgi:hypothetical protein